MSSNKTTTFLGMKALVKNWQSLESLAAAALDMVQDGYVVGLGSGRAATAFVRGLGERVQAGLRVRAVPSSQSTADLAAHLKIPLVALDDVESIDVAVDGADEVDPNLNLIKGLGGALVREKIIAATCRRFVILVGVEKLVSTLGEHGVLPIEVVPFGFAWCGRRLTCLGYPAAPRRVDGIPFVTDNGNYILDCRTPLLRNPAAVEQTLREIPGVVGTGLFLGMAQTVLVDDNGRIEVRHRPSS
jgi:ribose 5-phosphate isomerase A